MENYRSAWIRRGSYAAAHAIRIRVFVEEQGFQEEIDGLDDDAWHLVLYDGDVPFATARAFLEADGLCRIGRVAVLPEYRGRHLGEELMRRMEAHMAELGATRFVVGAQVRASGFYRKLGYVPHGAEYLDEYCPHVEMYKPPLASADEDRCGGRGKESL